MGVNKVVKHCVIFNTTIQYGISRTGGGHRIASFLREQGWDAEVIDFAGFWNLEQLQELARSRINSNTVFFGFSPFFRAWAPHIEQFCQWMKQHYPAVTLIVGGQRLPTQLSSNIDYYVVGYGEYALLELLKYLAGNSTTKPNYMMEYFGQARVIDATHQYPAYPMRQAKIIYEYRDFLAPEEWLTTEFSRGCKFKCLYCDFPVLGVKGDYTRDADDFVEQVTDAYDRFGITNYVCSDETFNDRTEKIIKFADAVDTLSFRPWISGFIRADLMVARPQDWEPLLRMGFLGHFYGIETSNWKTAKTIGKGMHPDKLLPGLVNIKNYFKTHGERRYRGTVSFMAGLPHETYESLQKTIDWCETQWRGESVFLNPLEIEKSSINSVELSELSLDWKKYGYREAMNSDKQHFETKLTDTVMNWENDNMNYRDLSELCTNLKKTKWETDDYTISNFVLGKYARAGSSIDDLLKLTIKSAKLAFTDQYFKDFYQRYINKKLSI